MEALNNPTLDAFAKQQEKYRVAKSIEAKFRAAMAPAGTYNIPEILEQRRMEYGIPNGAFESYPSFDKVYIWQIPLPGQGTDKWAEDGVILKPETTQHAERNSAPRGIVVSAGLQAMDSLYSSGIGIGHIVRFKKLSPFIMPVAIIEGKQFNVYVIRDGDIEASEDMASELHAKRISIKNVSDKGYDWRIAAADGTVTGQKTSPFYDPSI